MISLLMTQVFVIAQAYSFTKTVMKIYNLTLSVEAVKVLTSLIINKIYC